MNMNGGSRIDYNRVRDCVFYSPITNPTGARGTTRGFLKEQLSTTLAEGGWMTIYMRFFNPSYLGIGKNTGAIEAINNCKKILGYSE